MKKIFTIFAAALLPLCCLAQTDENFLQRYNILVARVGCDGIGVKTLLDKWERADELDMNLRIAQFNYYLAKSQRDTVITSYNRKYYGRPPAFSLRDSTGRKVYYFNDVLYDEPVFRQAMSYLDKAIATNNSRLDLYRGKFETLLSFEKGNPVESTNLLLFMIGRNYNGKSRWDYPGQDVNDEVFCSWVQDYCHTLFDIGTRISLESFRKVSQAMLKHDPENATFLDDIGTYYLVVEKNQKKAVKCYNKALKSNSSDSIAQQNLELIRKRSGSLAR